MSKSLLLYNYYYNIILTLFHIFTLQIGTLRFISAFTNYNLKTKNNKKKIHKNHWVIYDTNVYVINCFSITINYICQKTHSLNKQTL